jgi:hypothetical protein
MTKKPTEPSNQSRRRDELNLDSRYGAIGISAVAAALQFKCEVKNPAYAPPAPQSHDDQVPGLAA